MNLNKTKNNDPKYIGQKFGRLTVIGFGESVTTDGLHQVTWDCQCACGNIIRGRRPRNVKSGQTRSCGCLKQEQNTKNLADHRRTHGMSETRIFGIWEKMRDRCNNPNTPAYKNYGGRGIKVCPEWDASFEAFWDWARHNGYQDDLTIDRIDNDGDYCPNNCKWVTRTEQQRNKRNIRYVEVCGERMPLKTACEKLGVPYKAVHLRITRRGWDIDRALHTPIQGKQS